MAMQPKDELYRCNKCGELTPREKLLPTGYCSTCAIKSLQDAHEKVLAKDLAPWIQNAMMQGTIGGLKSLIIQEIANINIAFNACKSLGNFASLEDSIAQAERSLDNMREIYKELQNWERHKK